MQFPWVTQLLWGKKMGTPGRAPPQLQGRDLRNKPVLYLLAQRQFLALLPWVTSPHQRLSRTISQWRDNFQKRDVSLVESGGQEAGFVGRGNPMDSWWPGRKARETLAPLFLETSLPTLHFLVPFPGFCTAFKPRPSPHLVLRDMLPTPHSCLYWSVGRVLRGYRILPLFKSEQYGTWGSNQHRVKYKVSGAHLPGFKQSPALPYYFNFLPLNFFIYKMGVIIVPTSCFMLRNKWSDICKVLRTMAVI